MVAKSMRMLLKEGDLSLNEPRPASLRQGDQRVEDRLDLSTRQPAPLARKPVLALPLTPVGTGIGHRGQMRQGMGPVQHFDDLFLLQAQGFDQVREMLPVFLRAVGDEDHLPGLVDLQRLQVIKQPLQQLGSRGEDPIIERFFLAQSPTLLVDAVEDQQTGHLPGRLEAVIASGVNPG